jgi:hypothetical protein
MDSAHPNLSMVRQCEPAGLARSSYYISYRPYWLFFY